MATPRTVAPDLAAAATAVRPASDVRPAIAMTALFGAAIGLSAFLLFSVEPLVGRLALPVFGGTPAVWATVLAFFQCVLLLGYLYGHLSVTRLGMWRGAAVHVALVGAAALALLAAPTRVADLRDPTLPPVINLLGILAATIGLPAFTLTTTTPLLSAWWAARRGAGADAYWFYALSNAGSFAALLAYPFVLEPALGLGAQRGAWAVGFAALGLLLAGCSVQAWRTGKRVAPAATPSADVRTRIKEGSPIHLARRLRWLGLAAIPAGLLSAVTNQITTDLVAAPLLWIVPLAIYLATFVVAFSVRGRRVIPAAIALAPAMATLLWVPFGSAAGWPVAPLLVVEFVGFAVVATALHGRLALDRPEPARLTEFYLVISAGGVLGGSFVGILAPSIFPAVWEYPILIAGAVAALAFGAGARSTGRGFAPIIAGARVRLAPYVVVGGLLAALLVAGGSTATEAGLRWLAVGGLILFVGGPPRFFAVTTTVVLAMATFVLAPPAVFRDRDFFGVVSVVRPAGEAATVLTNGTTVHGRQSLDPALRREPASYYAKAGPLGDVFVLLESGPRSIGAVGLGAGTIATYLRPGDALTFYEIDPLVAQVASDTRYFTYLADAAERPSIVLGDARLSLAEVAPGSFDLLVLDAFSSDAIPTHLLTVEALAEDVALLRPGGLVAVHLSNRYYDLSPAVAAAFDRLGLDALHRAYVPTEEELRAGASPARWLLAWRPSDIGEGTLAWLATKGWTAVPGASSAEPLTDDHADVLRFLKLGGS
jgi:hypothetical protein